MKLGLPGGLPHRGDSRRVLVLFSVGSVQPENIHSRSQKPVKHTGNVGSGS